MKVQIPLPSRQSVIDRKREDLFRNLALIHSLARVIQIAYFSAVKDTNFRKPKIKAKSDLIHKYSEDIIKSLGDAIRLKEDTQDFMEYEHFTEVYELLKGLVFRDTDVVKEISKLLNKPSDEEQ